MYFAVIDAYFDKTLKLQLFEIQELHKIFDVGQDYFHPMSEQYKKMKAYKVSLKKAIDNDFVSGGLRKNQIPVNSIRIELLFESITKQKNDNSDDLQIELAS